MGDKGKQVGAAIGRYVIFILVGIVLVAGYSGISSYVSSHSKQLAKGDYQDMNALVEAGKDLPANEFGRLSIRWVLGSFATEENSVSSYGAKFSAGKSSYYLAILDDFSTIAVQAADSGEIKRLEAMAADFSNADDIYSLAAQDFEGKIERLTNSKLKSIYDEALEKSGISGKDMFTVKYLILNTGAIPGQNILLYAVLPLAAVALLIFVLVRLRKKRKEEDAPAAPPAEPQE